MNLFIYIKNINDYILDKHTCQTAERVSLFDAPTASELFGS